MTDHDESSDAREQSGTDSSRLAKVSQLEFDVAFFAQILERAPNYVDVLRCQAQSLSMKGLHVAAAELDRRLSQLCPEDEVVRYNFACSLAATGSLRQAVDQLRAALELGYHDLDHLFSDPDLDALRDVPEYHALLREFALAEAETAEGS